MAGHEKPEVNLEISSGFFRIPTTEMTYNITVISGGGVQVVEKIVEVEKQSKQSIEPVVQSVPQTEADSYYQQICQYTLNDFTSLTKSFSQIIDDFSQAEGIEVEASASPVDLSSLKSGLSSLKEHGLFVSEGVASEGEAGGSLDLPDFSEDVADIVGKLQQAKGMIGDNQVSDAVESNEIPQDLLDELPDELPDYATESAMTTKTMYIFDLDVVFQTLYELCTNEAVKTHITTGRENRDTYFDKDQFLDLFNNIVSTLEADGDNFFNVPMSDAFTALHDCCLDKPIQNLFKKMDQNQAQIFLDQFLPLEVPPTEELEVPGEAPAAEAEAAPEPEPEPAPEPSPETEVSVEGGNGEPLTEVLDGALAAIEGLAGKISDMDVASPQDSTGGPDAVLQQDAIAKVDELLAGIDALEGSTSSDGSPGATVDTENLIEFQKGLLSAVLTLKEEIGQKQVNEGLSADQGRTAAQQETDAKLAGAGDCDSLQQLINML